MKLTNLLANTAIIGSGAYFGYTLGRGEELNNYLGSALAIWPSIALGFLYSTATYDAILQRLSDSNFGDGTVSLDNVDFEEHDLTGDFEKRNLNLEELTLDMAKKSAHRMAIKGVLIGGIENFIAFSVGVLLSK